MKRTGEKGIEGRSGGEQRKEKGAKVRARVEERDREERREKETVETVRTCISSHFQLNPQIVFWSLQTAGRRK